MQLGELRLYYTDSLSSSHTANFNRQILNETTMKTSAFPGKLVGILLAIGLLGWVVYSSGYFQTDTGEGSNEEPPSAMTASDALANAFSRNDWQDVETACRVLLNKDPFHAEARFNLGYSLFRQDRLEEAAENYIQSKDFLPFRDYSFFNLACIYARQKKQDLAIENLQKALENGFASSRGILINQDLIALRDHPLFQKLVDMENNNRGNKNEIQGN